MKTKITLKELMNYKKLMKEYPDIQPTYLPYRKRYLRQFKVVRAYWKTKWFLSELFGVIAAGGDGDCDGYSERYVFRLLFLEVYLGDTFTRSLTAPPDVPYDCSHGLKWELKDLLSGQRWRLNSMFSAINE